MQKIRAGTLLRRGGYTLFSYLIAGTLVGAILAYYVPDIRTQALPLSLLFLTGLGYVIYGLYREGTFSRVSFDE
ncbi:MAG: hypothetical protein GWN24_11310, partial [Nitrospinaceae bacterium]|nr:hypothetical protein [Nitrospinaceae bacterium]